MQIDVTDSDDAGIRAAIQAELASYNQDRLGQSPDRHTMAVLLRGTDTSVLGGIWGTVSFGWLSVDLAFVPVGMRRQGGGSAMLVALEQAATRSGARGVRALSFQAPGFFARQGYSEYGRLKDCPPGYSDIALFKLLTLAEDDAGMVVMDRPDPALREALRRLQAAEDSGMSGDCGQHPLSVVLRAPDGTIQGGMTGYTAHGWLQVSLLALPQALRGAGTGTRILTMAHQAAQARGVAGARLATGSHQARPFYEKLGYRVFATLDNYQPGGLSRFLMAKRFDR
jgi:GNAT superfamily N-acetyltransferase